MPYIYIFMWVGNETFFDVYESEYGQQVNPTVPTIMLVAYYGS